MDSKEQDIDIENGSLLKERRRADATTQLQIDESVLEYLAYKATKAVLREFQVFEEASSRGTKKQQRASSLDLVDSFLVVFRSLHGEYQGTQELQSRLRLLRFATLFTTRQSMRTLRPWMQDLSAHRAARQRMAHTFNSDKHVLDLTTSPFANISTLNKQQRVAGDKSSHESEIQGNVSLPLISLIDTLPLFMALSAAVNSLQGSKITDTWMRLAAGYMAQAVLEQYLVYNSLSNEIVTEAFAWGFDSATMAEEESEDWAVNAMFLDEEGEFESWQLIRDDHIRALVPPEGCDLADHFRWLRENDLSLPTFEHTILTFLEGILHSLPRPILAQIGLENVERNPDPRHGTQAEKDQVGLV